MTTVVLHGALGDKFGRTHNFDLRTPIEAIRALSANFKTFRQYLYENSTPGYKIVVDNKEFDKDELIYPVNSTINIVPVIAGAGGGIGKIIAGVALIALAIYLPQLAVTAVDVGAAAGGVAASTVTTGSWAVTLGSIAGNVGTALVLGGVSELLFAPPKQSTNSVEESKNTNFDGPVNLTSQGTPVPLAYGKVMVGSVVIGSGIFTSSARDPSRVAAANAATAVQKVYIGAVYDEKGDEIIQPAYTRLSINLSNIEAIVSNVQVIMSYVNGETDINAAANYIYSYSRDADFSNGTLTRSVTVPTGLNPYNYWIRLLTIEGGASESGPHTTTTYVSEDDYSGGD